MPDISAIAGMMSSFKAATEITSALVNIRDARLVQEKAVELNALILTAQQSAFAAQRAQTELLDRVSALEKEIADLKNWDAEKQSYELKEVAPGAFAYARKPAMQGSEPAHCICAKCYQQRATSILQLEIRAPGMDHVMICHACGSELFTSGFRRPAHGR